MSKRRGIGGGSLISERIFEYCHSGFCSGLNVRRERGESVVKAVVLAQGSIFCTDWIVTGVCDGSVCACLCRCPCSKLKIQMPDYQINNKVLYCIKNHRRL